MSRLAVLFLLLTALPLRAEQALIAVAANFLKPAEVLAAAYEEQSGHEISLAGGSTGQHYAQIIHGAPYDAFLAADGARPALLVDQNLGDGRFTYAVGRLALFSAGNFTVAEGLQPLLTARFVAIANPALAPYGRAAHEVLEGAALWVPLRDRIVQGQNAGQAFGMVASGNAEVGLVALSQAKAVGGDYWEIPAHLHSPIRQDAVLLSRGKGNLAAEGFLAYLGSDAALAAIESFGYDRPEPE
ncbi:MAG: molybdate ABC transporter substrate-binding protein [Paracoccaceae bacterium]|jgi:molybdate transport system substrate-binding protein|nr:molybdate ABC transporter substrate-binding protein [Paracoccaceae bacterium]